MFEPNKRKIWDKSIKSVQLLDTIFEISPYLKCYTYHTWFKSPMLLVSERDIVEKRIDIIEDGYAIMIGFSTPNDYISEQKKVIRCLNYINIQIVEERKDYFLFVNYGCGDLKMPIPESLLNFTLPSKYNDWFKEFTKSFKK